jgi:putative ABC transport system permease protein
MRTPISWLNSIEHPRRTAAAVGGMCFALLMIFMQAGFLGAARANVSIIYAALDFDLVIHSRSYLTLPRSDPFDRLRLAQASSVPGVASVTRFLTDSFSWRNPRTGSAAGGFMLAVPADSKAFLDPRINDQLHTVRPTLTALVDRKCRPSYGPWQVGEKCVLNGQPTSITGEYELGLGLLADGSVIVSDDTYERLQGPGNSRYANLGLIKVTQGADILQVAQALRQILPNDVAIVTRSDIIRREQNYFINVKPVGIMFQVGMFVAFAAGAAILYQILGSEMNKRLGEFATLKALGYPTAYIYSIGIQQGLIYALLAYGPALLLAEILYRVARTLSGFPLYMDVGRAGFVFALAIAMCAFAALLSLWKIRRADPADLF